MQLNQMIDHTALKPDVTKEDILQLVEEAKEYQFFSVCVNPTWVKLASEKLAGTSVAVCTVIGFPLGANTTAVKAFETKNAIENGATEVDMVINVGELKSGNTEYVRQDIQAVVEAAKDQALVKVILETCLLTDEEIRLASQLSKEAGADFVKTSTGFSIGGATVEAVKIMRETVGSEMGVKASGGIHNADDAEQMIAAGATRIGASAGIAIVTGKATETKGY